MARKDQCNLCGGSDVAAIRRKQYYDLYAQDPPQASKYSRCRWRRLKTAAQDETQHETHRNANATQRELHHDANYYMRRIQNATIPNDANSVVNI